MLCCELDDAFTVTRERARGTPRKFVLCAVMKTVNPGKIAFRQQLFLGLQPVLDIVAGLRSLVHIVEISPSGHFVGEWHKVIRGLFQVVSRCEPFSIFECSALLMRMSVVFHKKEINSINGL
jgi:hypothetical protein